MSGRTSRARSWLRSCSTTPTTSAMLFASPVGPSWSCLPTAFCPGQACLASVSSITITGGFPTASSQVSVRPARRRVFMARRTAGETVRPSAVTLSQFRAVASSYANGEREPLPVSGSCEVRPTWVTPGTWPRRRSSSRVNVRRLSGVGYRPGGRASWNVSTSLASKPGRTCCSDRKLRTRRPAPISRITDSATSPRISAFRTRCRARARSRAPAGLERALSILSRRLQRRRQPERQRRHQAGERRERQDRGRPRRSRLVSAGSTGGAPAAVRARAS